MAIEAYQRLLFLLLRALTSQISHTDLSVLMVAIDMLKKIEAKGKPDRGVVLVTNGRSPYDAEKDQLYIDLICVKCQEDGISILV